MPVRTLPESEIDALLEQMPLTDSRLSAAEIRQHVACAIDEFARRLLDLLNDSRLLRESLAGDDDNALNRAWTTLAAGFAPRAYDWGGSPFSLTNKALDRECACLDKADKILAAAMSADPRFQAVRQALSEAVSATGERASTRHPRGRRTARA